MRRYDIVTGLLLILSVVDFARAAPVLVQEKRQAGVHVVHMPKDVITVLGKRAGEELEKLAAKYFKTLENPIDSSDAHASSSSALPGPDHGSTNVVHSPAPNPASSTANPDPLTEPSSPSSTPETFEDQFNALWDEAFSAGSSGYDADRESILEAHSPRPNLDPDFGLNYWHDPPPRPVSQKEIGQPPEYPVEHVQQPNPGPSNPGPSNPGSSSSAPPEPDHGSTNVVQPPAPDPVSSTANPDPLMEPSSPLSTSPMPKPFEDRFNALWDETFPAGSSGGADHESMEAHSPRPNPPDPDFGQNYWMHVPPLSPASPKEIGLAEHPVEHVQQPNPGPSNPGPSSSAPPEPDHGSTNVMQSPALNPASSTANPGPLVESSSPLSTAPMQGSWDHFNALWDDQWSYKPGAHVPQPNPNPRAVD